ncbi:ankyrin repeat domain-containing protein [Candidatus Babeliales bacterium]|nr:ankyrin repeat domain-containing protein [Candidatus Babeliales bacterium]
MIKITKVFVCALLLNTGLWAASSSSFSSLSESETEELTGALEELKLDKHYGCSALKRTLLHIAAEQGNIKAIVYLIERGDPINVRDYAGNTPLHTAAIFQYAQPEVFDLLIQLGADRYVRNNKGELAWPKRQMLWAAKAGDLATMQELCRYDASLIEAYDLNLANDCLYVLHYLVLSRNYAALTWACAQLMARGESVDSTGSYWTPLQLAAFYQDKKAWDILIACGASQAKTSWDMAHMQPWCDKFICTYYADGKVVTMPRHESKGGCSIV